MTIDGNSPEQAAAYRALVAAGRIDAFARSREQFSEFFASLDLIGPGVEWVTDWPEPLPDDQRPGGIAAYGAVGRKP
ncbi:SAM-dependent methyltransferase [Winogradskya humida]|uniref:Uncharacterized protein n=1 Tax=Winogradskya humida TaxID=113566 RepID=A0ABQ4A645_9ACTN|nr:SAM-dependent methyltransferase [Actinoplanes humidus]GIE25822.1 hypothetical protein Ahu01nite_089240 [Actinoplanes humidus]